MRILCSLDAPRVDGELLVVIWTAPLCAAAAVSQSVSHVHARRRECVAFVDARQRSRPFLILLRLRASEHMTAVTVFYNSSHEDGVLLHWPDCALTPITRNEHIYNAYTIPGDTRSGQTSPSAFSRHWNVSRSPKTSRWHLTHSSLRSARFVVNMHNSNRDTENHSIFDLRVPFFRI